jgi:hypothetical protein
MVKNSYLIDPKYVDPIPFDTDLFNVREQWYRIVAAQVLSPTMKLANWVVVANITSMTLHEWNSLDELQQEAVAVTVRDFIKKREDANQKAMGSIKDQIEASKSSKSLFDGVPLPAPPR